jgi:hypothetical protein
VNYDYKKIKKIVHDRLNKRSRIIMPARETYVAIRTCIVHVATTSDGKKFFIHKHNL